MLLIPAQIKPSIIHGLGVFTTCKISKDTVVWYYRDPPDYRWDKIYPSLKKFAAQYGYKPIGKNYHEFAGDMAMFINHSKTPNLTCYEDGMFANRDISVGEELLQNYYEFCSDPESGGKLLD